MTAQNRIKTVVTVVAVAMAILVLTGASADAAVVTNSGTKPVVNSEGSELDDRQLNNSVHTEAKSRGDGKSFEGAIVASSDAHPLVASPAHDDS